MKRNCEKKKGAGGEKNKANRNIQVRWNIKRAEVRPEGVFLSIFFGRWQISGCNSYTSQNTPETHDA